VAAVADDLLNPDLSEAIGVDDADAALAGELAASIVLDAEDWAKVPLVVDVIWAFAEAFTGVKMYPYQEEFGRRLIESVVINDGATISALFSRQSGKTETVANVVCALMVMLPILAQMPEYEHMLAKFKHGIMVGTFGPVKDQAETLYDRITDRLTSSRADAVFADPEVDDQVETKGKVYRLKRLRSLVRVQTAHPKAHIESKTYHLLIIDECFPAGTPILTSEGRVPIEQIVDGPPKNWLVATQDTDKSVVKWAHVKTAYRTPRRTDFVRVVHEHGSFYCTANHPVVVGLSRVAAKKLTPGTPLSLVSKVVEQPGSTSEIFSSSNLRSYMPSFDACADAGRVGFSEQTVRENEAMGANSRGTSAIKYAGKNKFGKITGAQPRSSGSYASAQSDEERCIQREDAADFEIYRPSTPDTGGERARFDEAAGVAIDTSRKRVGSRACVASWRRKGEGQRSDALQDRYSASKGENSDRGRWGESRHFGTPGTGSSQDNMVTESRVVSVEVLQPGNPYLAGLSDGGDFVYTLEVDSESHTYVASDVLVGNCQNADERVVNKSISPMGASTNATTVMLGTPTTEKGVFYKTIRRNKRDQTKRGEKQNHFEFNWKIAAKYNPNYAAYVKKEMSSLGVDSDEFRMAYNCVTPETRVLTADMRHIPAGDITVGTKLVGFDEERPSKGMHRRFRESVVTSAARIMRPSYRVHLDDGTSVAASAGHKWLVFSAGSRTIWKTTESLLSTDRIFRLSSVWDTERSYESGYLAAAFEGEGSVAYGSAGQPVASFAQKENVMIEQVRKHLSDLGFQWRDYLNSQDVNQLFIAGGRAAIMRFLGQVRPQRLLNKLDVNRLGSIGRHDRDANFVHPRVERVEFLGEQEVIALETTTHTFVAEGLATHNCEWILERGMFVTTTAMDELGDRKMGRQKSFHGSCLAGIDPARKIDSTVVTVVWVDWDLPNENGLCHHRILDWLEMPGEDWETQYFRAREFLLNYNLVAVGIDGGGMGDAFADRMRHLLPESIAVEAISSSPSAQSVRWRYLTQLLTGTHPDYGRTFSYPASYEARRTKTYQRFYAQMTDVVKKYVGNNLMVEAPDEVGAHDDFVDSLALACIVGQEMIVPEVQVSSQLFYGSR
jgi:hypothetical protein